MRKLAVHEVPLLVGVAALSVWLVPRAAAAAPDMPWTMAKIFKEAALSPRLEHANAMVGGEVYDPRGYLVGRVSEVLLSRDFDRVAIALIAPEKDAKAELPVPLTVFRREATSRLTVDVVAGDLARLPKVDSGDWSELANAGFLEKIDFFFKGHSTRYKDATANNEPPVLGASEDTGMLMPKATAYQRLTKLVGLDIRTRDVELAASLEDLVIDFIDGKVVYGVLSLNRSGRDERLVVVPWTAIEVRPRQRMGRVDATLDTLETLAFAPASFPNLQDRIYANSIYQAFGREPYWQVYGYAPRTLDRKAAWRAGSDFNRGFDVKKVKTYIGLVESVGTFVPETGAADGVRLRVRNEQGDFLTVLVGPRTYADRMGLDLHQGADVLLTGAESSLDGKTVILAAEVQAAGQTFRFRDANGQPLWRSADIE